ncbi:MAG: transcription/translation regulatory transformer protein RfaH [Gammaproteobacteria bacterium]|nr:MAG: transcription/translation regulatory transformer protein RfaH [Gammaproteobacteria bacterium]
MNWYLIQCKYGQEDRAVLHLCNQGFQCYKPEIITEKINKGVLVKAKEPLFPGYLFINIDIASINMSAIRSTRGVIKLVSFGSKPIPVDESMISGLKDSSDHGNISRPLFSKGDNISVIDGPFEQLDAIYHEMDGDKRAIVLLNMMNKWHRVKLPLEQLSA